MKTSCAGAIRGLWDELNQGLFPGIDDNIGELDAKHRLFRTVCEAVIKPREFEYAKWKGNGRPPASRLKIFKAFLLKTVLNVKDTKELVRMLRAEPHLFDLADAAYDAEPIRAACAQLGTVAVIDANPRRSAEAHAMSELEREVYRDRSAAERFFSHLLESHGGRTVRVRAPAKVALHLLLGTIVVAVEQMLRMVSAWSADGACPEMGGNPCGDGVRRPYRPPPHCLKNLPAPARHERWRNRSARLPSHDLPDPAHRGFEITSRL